MMRTLVRLATAASFVVGSSMPLAWAQTGRSVDAAAALASLMDARELGVFAAADPEEPGRFIAVMYFPGSQLLVVSARYAVPVLMQQRLEQGQYQQAYMDLQCASVTESKWFVQDLNANGLWPTRKPDEPFDIVYRSGVGYVALDGDWARQALTEGEYRHRYGAADERYSRMLTVLAAALRSQT